MPPRGGCYKNCISIPKESEYLVVDVNVLYQDQEGKSTLAHEVVGFVPTTLSG